MGLYKQPVLFALPEMLLSFLFLLSPFQVLDSIVCMIVMGASFVFSAETPPFAFRAVPGHNPLVRGCYTIPDGSGCLVAL